VANRVESPPGLVAVDVGKPSLREWVGDLEALGTSAPGGRLLVSEGGSGDGGNAEVGCFTVAVIGIPREGRWL